MERNNDWIIMTNMLLTALNLEVNMEIRDITLEMKINGQHQLHILEEILKEIKNGRNV